MEWFALLIPIISIPLMRIIFPHKIVWWELFIPIFPALIIIPVVKYTSETIITSDYERWGGWVTEARYYEDWNEYIHKTCTRQVPAGRDSKGNQKYRTETYDCSYVDYHPEYWEISGSNGEIKLVSKQEYDTIKLKFNNESFVDMYRYYHTNDGDMYKTSWSGSETAVIPLFTEHYYRNKVQANHGVFQYETIDEETAAILHKFPKLTDMFNDRAILGQPYQAQADQKLQYYNGRLGRQYQIRYWILLFKNQPRATGLKQESYWKGGNKNEFVVCINTDNNDKPTWCHCFCWSPDGYTGNDVMKIEMRDFVEGQKSLDLFATIEKLVLETKQNWKRKSFDEFDYLDVDMPTSIIVTIYLITLLTTGGVCYFTVYNEFIDKENSNKSARFQVFTHTLHSRIYEIKCNTKLYWKLKDFKNRIIFQYQRIKTNVKNLFRLK